LTPLRREKKNSLRRRQGKTSREWKTWRRREKKRRIGINSWGKEKRTTNERKKLGEIVGVSCIKKKRTKEAKRNVVRRKKNLLRCPNSCVVYVEGKGQIGTGGRKKV